MKNDIDLTLVVSFLVQAEQFKVIDKNNNIEA